MQSIVQHACYSNAEVHGRRGLGPVIITNDTSRHWPCLAPFNHQCAPQTTETIATHSFHCLAALLLAHTLMNETFWFVDFILRNCVRRIRSLFLLFKIFFKLSWWSIEVITRGNWISQEFSLDWTVGKPNLFKSTFQSHTKADSHGFLSWEGRLLI